MTTLILPVLLLVASPTPDEPSSLAVDVTLAAEGREATTRLTVTGDRDCASAREQLTEVDVDVRVCRDGGGDDAPVLTFDVERVVRRANGTERKVLRAKARVALGRAVPIARAGEGAGRVDVTARVVRLAPER
jgi:hypothetical protein